MISLTFLINFNDTGLSSSGLTFLRNVYFLCLLFRSALDQEGITRVLLYSLSNIVSRIVVEVIRGE
jgi:hypothetical protein